MVFKPPRAMSWELNLAPMVDVMMCLIIFFLLATELVDRAHRPVDLPFAMAARSVDRSKLGSRIVINVRPKEAGGAAEYVVAGWDGRKITELALAPGEIEGFLKAKAVQASREDDDGLRCVIRADKRVQYADVEIVLRACGLAKIGKVVFSANAGADPDDPSEATP